VTDSTSTNEDEFYDDASSEFPSPEDLCPTDPKGPVVGRLVAIWAVENGSAKGENGPYPYTESITLVLDDGPNGDLATALIGKAPQRLDLRHSTTGIQSRLRGRVEGVNAKGVPMKYRPMIGRVNTRPSTKYKKGSPAFSIAEPTPEDRAVIDAHKAEIIAINRELEAKDKEAENAAAFDA
jgi:hypothetical protein